MGAHIPFAVTPIDFATIMPIWRDLLWPGRASPIKPLSSMVFLGGYDMSIYKKYGDQALFFGIYDTNDNLIGVQSGHPTSDTEYRARGLFVMPQFMGRGIGRNLMEAVLTAASDAGRDVCWSIPRVQTIPFYQRVGFVQMSQPFTDGVEFGPNVYMAHAIIPG